MPGNMAVTYFCEGSPLFSRTHELFYVKQRRTGQLFIFLRTDTMKKVCLWSLRTEM